MLKLLKNIFKGYSNCRVCGEPIKNNGAIIPYIGKGFCPDCARQIFQGRIDNDTATQITLPRL